MESFGSGAARRAPTASPSLLRCWGCMETVSPRHARLLLRQLADIPSLTYTFTNCAAGRFVREQVLRARRVVVSWRSSSPTLPARTRGGPSADEGRSGVGSGR